MHWLKLIDVAGGITGPVVFFVPSFVFVVTNQQCLPPRANLDRHPAVTRPERARHTGLV